ncbi:FxsA family protein [Geomonas sp. RF6]|uniref:FxsA family protein n=1 Tax=Geomonas sp. RF6 TaxID=2897342 RepID=UPI001E2FBF1A|nr:FxsA family protein [Geomonas sp. RF6]UFS71011.1 FxsA family protein [Geomonas sp. RF6]
MFSRLFLVFLIVPVIEIYLLIKVGSVIGGVPTVLALLLISAIGAYLVKSQGLKTFSMIRSELGHGHLPAAQLLDAFLILVGGLLLMTPGFFTDFLGIFFLIPATRILIKRWLGLWLQAKLASGRFVMRRH